MSTPDVIIIGAGAAGLMCAIEAAKRGRRVQILDHANRPGKKILMSGGGRCNFTNIHTSPDNFISHNPHFCKSALSRYTPWHFIDLVKHYNISYHEKTLGQLFCDQKSKAILEMLLAECQSAGAAIQLNTSIEQVKQTDAGFALKTSQGKLASETLVVASGGLSIPTMGASPFGYRLAQQFDLPVYPTRAGLVPFTLDKPDKDRLEPLSGVSFDSIVDSGNQQFRENTLITHRGLSGPAILQISSYWQPGTAISINCLPELNLIDALTTAQSEQPNVQIKTWLSPHLPKRFIPVLLAGIDCEQALKSLNTKQIQHIAQRCQAWQIKPNGTEGYRTAEVTLGGVSCDELSSKTMETKRVPGLFFIGEVVDVTGWLGGYNFQWAWASAWAAGQVV